MEATIFSIFTWISPFKYFLLFALAVIEGPFTMTISGFLLRLGYIGFVPTYAVLVTGDLLGDTMWYTLGYYWARPFINRFGKYFGITDSLIKKTENLFGSHQSKIIFFSKITMGFGFALLVLMTAGMIRIKLKKFIAMNALGELIWLSTLLSVGYFFGTMYITVNQDIRIISLVAGGVFFALCLFQFARYIRGRVFSNKI